jgi:hypothetical protein
MTAVPADHGQRRARSLIIIGLALMVLAALDPLEGSIVVAGGGLMTLGAHMRESRHRGYLNWCLAMRVTGVAALWMLSAVGGFGGTSGRSSAWGLRILPYPIGWLAGLVGGVRAVREPRPAL